MKVQKQSEGVSTEADQPTLVVAVAELESQEYSVTINGTHMGLNELEQADELGELDRLPGRIGVRFEIENEKEHQVFRLHFFDLDAIGITAAESPPIMYDPGFTIKCVLYPKNWFSRRFRARRADWRRTRESKRTIEPLEQFLGQESQSARKLRKNQLLGYTSMSFANCSTEAGRKLHQ